MFLLAWCQIKDSINFAQKSLAFLGGNKLKDLFSVAM
jgi:hypothetical protein